jgi:hypothetical protein
MGFVVSLHYYYKGQLVSIENILQLLAGQNYKIFQTMQIKTNIMKQVP